MKEAFTNEILEYHKCRLPIPPNDLVRNALKKMMEERERHLDPESREGQCMTTSQLLIIIICVCVTTIIIIVVVVVIVVVIAKRKRLEEKKRRLPEGISSSVMDKQPKKKLRSNSPLSEADKSVLEHWNKIQQTLLNRAKERLGNKVDNNANMEEFFQHQELLIKQQSEQLDKQQSQMMEQQRRIQQQTEQIRILVHQQKVLIRECKGAGIKIPLNTPTPSPLTPPFSTLSPGLSRTQSMANSMPPNTTSLVTKMDSTTATTTTKQLIKKPSIVVSPVTTAIDNPPKTIAAPPQTTPIITTTSPLVTVTSQPHTSYPTNPLPPTQSLTPLSQPLPLPTQPLPLPTQSLPPPVAYIPSSPQFHPIPQVSMTTNDFMMSHYGLGPLQDPLIPYVDTSMLPPLPGASDYSSVFNPLTSKELLELTSREIHNLSPCDPNSVGSFNPPFDDLDNFFNLPTGCGAGYGVGITDDELQVSVIPNAEM